MATESPKKGLSPHGKRRPKEVLDSRVCGHAGQGGVMIPTHGSIMGWEKDPSGEAASQTPVQSRAIPRVSFTKEGPGHLMHVHVYQQGVPRNAAAPHGTPAPSSIVAGTRSSSKKLQEADLAGWRCPTPRALHYSSPTAEQASQARGASSLPYPKLHPELSQNDAIKIQTPRILQYRQAAPVPPTPYGLGGANLVLTPRAAPPSGYPLPVPQAGAMSAPKRTQTCQGTLEAGAGCKLPPKAKPPAAHQHAARADKGIMEVEASPQETAPGVPSPGSRRAESSPGAFLLPPPSESTELDSLGISSTYNMPQGGVLQASDPAPPCSAPVPLLTEPCQLDWSHGPQEPGWSMNDLNGRNETFDGLSTPRNGLEARLYLAQYTRLMLELAGRAAEVGRHGTKLQ
eukprot:jgi/Tetstr1/454471/TSEL_041371.t1